MRRQGYLSIGISGTLSWHCDGKQTGSVDYLVATDKLILFYRIRNHDSEWEDVKEEIVFDKTSCNYGGVRTWFKCPQCSRRVEVLYVVDKYFLCRHCYNLTYRSQQETKCDRLVRKADKIWLKVGGNHRTNSQPPQKPKGMHWKTYQRLYTEALHNENLAWSEANQRFCIS
jgi:hypothetical protein